MEQDSADSIALAAIVYGDGIEVNSLLENFARRLLGRGVKVQGLVQHRMREAQQCESEVVLAELDCRQTYRISQNLGPGSACCSVDTSGIAEASVALRRAMGTPLDLLVINKFGKLEADGDGFADEILGAASEGVAVLTTVSERHLAAWRTFSGGLGGEIAPRMDALEAWWSALALKRSSAA